MANSFPKFSVIAGAVDASDAFVAYAPQLGFEVVGTVSYSLAAVPEPETYALFLAGLGLLALARRSKATA